jgi:hypothetical protein
MSDQWDTEEITTVLAVFVPAVRLVILEAWVWEEGGELKSGTAIAPVIAVEASVAQRFTRRRPQHQKYSQPLPAMRRDYEAHGWSRDHCEKANYQPLVVGPDGAIERECEYRDDTEKTFVAVAPWPPEEDEGRFAEKLEELRNSALAALGYRLEYRAKQQNAPTEPNDSVTR